ncbi:MAG TPA: peptide chain release factor N(5)-glutamine methyltransferase [Sedimentibacter sp.]|jgi:release factor glutamine methyltransferase|nr:peptide chain release factor N(5)-glutamine methyltransferase [Sedimentibacter sp.]HHZ00866.1 peptide chain release factor N(5)-glutamine methyltransferase [Tissierellia bacterium]HOK49142.1 peptide chain release factor N(5)-glutamine methyltransferase [Sedimentibacter sp.]HOW22744.1 peptide chain release factor N(5)-glutamine methyltransferase [Sedimentibacter sp.]HRC81522.1 peptide chain release factor N(5)-glutamine methyltransferase [Sedimentibacter sp.]
MVTIGKLIKDGLDIIRQREFNSPRLDVELILCYLLKKDRIFLHLNEKMEVSPDLADKFYELAKKRNEGYPLQYIINSQEFMGLDFYVREGVLIPRSDTEILVERVLEIAKERFRGKIKILDLGTGSGAIGVSLAYNLKNSFVTCLDISEIAVETANINVRKHKLENIKVIKADIFSYKSPEKFHVVVSNPPYIEKDTIKKLQPEVSLYEPRLALDGGEDGLDYYRRIVELFADLHEKEGVLAVEIGYDQKKSVEEIFMNSKLFTDIKTYKDLSGKDRVMCGFL